MGKEPRSEAFFGKIWIKCPKCFEKAFIKCDPGRGRGFLGNRINLLNWSSPTINCHNCGFHLAKGPQDWENHKNWFGPWVGRVEESCRRCGNRISHRTEPTTHQSLAVDLTCAACNLLENFILDWEEGTTDGLDPYFGLEFYYRRTIKGNLLWVLNEDHCDKLIAYIQPNQRIDHEREKWSLISNLPKWMIAAKNRDTVLKALMKIKKEIS